MLYLKRFGSFVACLFLVGWVGAACSGAEENEPGNSGGVEVIASGQLEIPPTPTLPPLPILGSAPDFQNDVWLNTPNEEAISIESLRGKVVLLEFWTFG